MRAADMIGILIGLVVFLSSLVGFFILARWVYRKLTNKPGALLSPNSSTIVNTKNTPKTQENKMADFNMFDDKLSIRFVIIGVIALLMLIPISNISSLVKERHGLYEEVLDGIAAQWGKPQVITGPALVLPIIEKYVIDEKIKTADGGQRITTKDVYKNKNLVILPKVLNKEIELDEHYRHRSIYKSLVYQAKIKIDGQFVIPDINKLSDNLHKVRYDKAFMLMGLSDTKAMNDVSKLELGGLQQEFEPGIKLNLDKVSLNFVAQNINNLRAKPPTNTELGVLSSGFHAPVVITAAKDEYEFNFNFDTKGSSNIRFSAFGETSTIKLKSSWQHPSFQGDILPTEHKISDDGFSAKWIIPSLARNFPQTWIAENRAYNLNSLLTGVDLYEPVFLYSLVSRAVKYGILFIALTFLTFLIFELTHKSKLHYVQYALIGLSLGLFFLTLLSLSEHIEFLYAYIIASAITIFSISIYTWFGARKLGQSLAIFVLLAALYIILYSLLQLEDYALLMGTGLLLVVLLVLMWITRNLKTTGVVSEMQAEHLEQKE